MNFLNKLERKFGKYAIPHLTRYIIITYVIGYLLRYAFPAQTLYLTLDPYQIVFHGQIWRLVSWLLIPPSSLDIFTVVMLFFYYSIGSTLEQAWGDFRYNVYIFFGIFMTIVGAFLLFLFTGLSYFGLYALSFSTYYISLSIFLGFAMSFPDMQVMLYFLIPIKMKYMALVYAVIVAADFFRGNLVTKVAIAFSLASVTISSSRPEIISDTIQEREKEKMISGKPCPEAAHSSIPMAQSINVPYAEEQSWILRNWNSVTVPSATGTMSTARTICLPTSISDRRERRECPEGA